MMGTDHMPHVHAHGHGQTHQQDAGGHGRGKFERLKMRERPLWHIATSGRVFHDATPRESIPI